MSQEFEEICQLTWNLLSKLQTKWKISLSFCSLLRKPELYEESKKHIKLSLLFRALMHCISSRLIMHRQELNGMLEKNDSFNFLKKQIRDMFLQDNVLGQLQLVFPGFENLRKSLTAL